MQLCTYILFLTVTCRAGSRRGRPGQTNSLTDLQTFFDLGEAGEPSLECVPSLRIIFGKILSCVETLVYWDHISDYYPYKLAPRAAARLLRPVVRS